MSYSRPFCAKASIPVSDAAGFVPKLAEYMGANGLRYHACEGRVWAEDQGGQWRFETRAQGLQIDIEGADAAARQRLCDTAAFLVEHIAPGLIGALTWEGLGTAGTLPANMQLGRLLGVKRLSPNFIRVRIGCDDAARLRRGGMHFSLLLPAETRVPVWPSLNEAGRTVWPQGADKLHRAVFTFVAFDPAQRWFEFDLFAHEGSPATRWAQSAQTGAPVAIAGPGGGDMPDLGGDGMTDLVMAGDETALPAIRHIMNRAPATQRGFVLLECADARDRLLGIVPEGVAVHWLDRTAGHRLADHLAHLPVPDPRAPFQLWIAGEQSMIRSARSLFLQDLALPKTRCYLSGYWTARP